MPGARNARADGSPSPAVAVPATVATSAACSDATGVQPLSRADPRSDSSSTDAPEPSWASCERAGGV